MNYKKETNGKKGEARTKNILLDHFIVHKIEPDIEGRDFMAELHDNVASVYAIIQAKYFEGINEVIIRKEYVIDEDGPKTEFFALLHTDNQDGREITYFFSACEIINTWRLSSRKKGQKRIDYYVFKLTKRDKNKFDSHKEILKSEINQRIEEGIRKTDEIRNSKNIRHIKDGFRNPTRQIFENRNSEFYEQISNYPIVDKIYVALNEFKDFRRIISWRLVDKIAFPENRHTSTFYNQLALQTNNTEIIKFFQNIEIDSKISVKNLSLFNKSDNLNTKVESIITTLHENLIFNVYSRNSNESFSTELKSKKRCKCVSCSFEHLDFSKSYSSFEQLENTSDVWDKMHHAYVLYNFGDYDKAKSIYDEIEKVAKEQNKPIVFFFAKYNQKLLAFKTIENKYPDLNIILDTLDISDEKKYILNSIASESLYNSYSKTIDEIYLKIKDFKQRYTINNTSDTILKLNSSVAEYLNFFDGNWLVTNSSKESDLLFEKVIESCIISYSMNTEYSSHLNSFNDFLVQISVHYCNSNKLLDFFQRNGVRSMPYKSRSNYLKLALTNFFSKKNVDFLRREICYVKNKTKRPDLRRKVIKTFKNLCILITYLDFKIENNTLPKRINYFIKRLDFGVDDLHTIAHPFLVKPHFFNSDEIIELIKILISRPNLYKGYLLTNCIYTLQIQGYIFNKSHQEVVDNLINLSIQSPRHGLLKALPEVIPTDKVIKLKNKIHKELKGSFKHELYYRAAVSGNIDNPKEFIDSYLKFFQSVKDKKQLSFFYADSPYTGVGEPLRENLNRLVEIILTINEKSLLQKKVLDRIINKYPYYRFILNIDEFDKNQTFDKFWLLENHSEIVLRRIAQNQNIRDILKNVLLKQQNKELTRIYFKYFSGFEAQWYENLR